AIGSEIFAASQYAENDSRAFSYIRRWNGSSWTGLGSGLNLEVFALVASGTDVFAGGPFSVAGDKSSIAIARWNASTFAACGNGTVDAGEQCDDGNTAANDCCSPECWFEDPFGSCRTEAGPCDAAEHCTGSASTCPADAKSAQRCRRAAGVCD